MPRVLHSHGRLRLPDRPRPALRWQLVLGQISSTLVLILNRVATLAAQMRRVLVMVLHALAGGHTGRHGLSIGLVAAIVALQLILL